MAGEVKAANVLGWLGYWRDKMPAEAVTRLQDILDAALSEEGPCGCQDACIEFSGNKCKGYGRVTIGGNKYIYAHRMAWLLAGKRLPKKPLQLDHLCRNRACINVNHLRVATTAENVLSGIGISACNARKTVCKSGHPFSGDNLRISHGKRYCRTCQRLTDKSRGPRNIARVREGRK